MTGALLGCTEIVDTDSAPETPLTLSGGDDSRVGLARASIELTPQS